MGSVENVYLNWKARPATLIINGYYEDICSFLFGVSGDFH